MKRMYHGLLISLTLLLIMAQLSGCKYAEDPVPSSETIEAQIAQAIEDAQLQGDLRLYATTGRRATLPGITQDDSEYAKSLCGVQYMTGTGDAFSTAEQREKRKQLIHFMTSYNQVIFEFCKMKRKRITF
jgi:hypothetical protein